MSTAERKYITGEEVRTLAEKLEVFAASLSTAERSLLGLALSNAAKFTELDPKIHHCAPERCPGTLEKLLIQGTNFTEGLYGIPDSVVAINPGKLRAKDDCEFTGFGRGQ